jgi:hypothetical protein
MEWLYAIGVNVSSPLLEKAIVFAVRDVTIAIILMNDEGHWQHGEASNGWRLFLALRFNLRLKKRKRTINLGEQGNAGLAVKADDEPDPTSVWDKMTESQIGTELSQVEVELSEAYATNGGKIGELESRKWRLRAELKFRECKGVSHESR